MAFLQRTMNRGSVSTGYEIANSCKFEADNTEIIYRTNESGTNRKTFTVSAWFKRTELGATQEVWHGGRNGETTVIGMITYSGFADKLWVDVGGGSGNTGTLYRSASTQKIRDTSAWYHVVVAVDTTQSTEANRMKVWLNGVEVTSWEQHQIPVQDYECALESGTEMAWGGYRPSNVDLLSGYIAEGHYLDGVTKVQTDFGEFDEDSGIWIPKKYTGTYGNNGCYMKFDDSSSMGADSSGNGNTFTLNNVSAANQATDTPTNNFCTLNPLFKYPSSQVIKEGATQVTRSSGSGLNKTFLSTIGVSSGKWYAEFKPIASSNYVVGIIPDSTSSTVAFDGNYIGNSAFPSSIGYYSDSGVKIVAPNGGSSYGNSYTTNDIIGIALDMDNAKLYFSKNGTYQNSGDPASGSTGTGAIDLTLNETTFLAFSYDSSGSMQVNFGGYHANSLSSAASDANGYGTFEYAPPSGFYALCGKNLAEFGGSA